MSMSRNEAEMLRIEESYPLDFEFSKAKFELPTLEVEEDNQKAFILEAGDYRMATLGYDTHCCQHLDAAGETAMMYGLMAPRAGFWAIEKNNRIIAQAEVWEGNIVNNEYEDAGKVFVFDNIELANDRDVSLIIPILRKWCEQYPYEDIAMGKGYNEVNIGEYIDEDCGYIQQPVCDCIPDPYTDAGVGNKVWLKKGGEVTF